MMRADSSLCRRSARMFVAMPSPDSSNSVNVRKPRTIRSRIIRSDQRSPNLSSDMLTGHPERCFGFDLPTTPREYLGNLQNASYKLPIRNNHWDLLGLAL